MNPEMVPMRKTETFPHVMFDRRTVQYDGESQWEGIRTEQKQDLHPTAPSILPWGLRRSVEKHPEHPRMREDQCMNQAARKVQTVPLAPCAKHPARATESRNPRNLQRSVARCCTGPDDRCLVSWSVGLCLGAGSFPCLPLKESSS